MKQQKYYTECKHEVGDIMKIAHDGIKGEYEILDILFIHHAKDLTTEIAYRLKGIEVLVELDWVIITSNKTVEVIYKNGQN